MRKYLLLIGLLAVMATASAKKYPFDMNHSYNVQQIRVAQDESRLVKTWGEAKNADKAIDRALQDAVACCIFMGIDALVTTSGHNAEAIPPLCPEGISAYQKHKEYFDKFFKNGDFLLYAVNTNSRYPTGENNVKVKNGRRVGIYAQLKVKQLRQRLEQDGIIKSLDNIWEESAQ